MKKPTNPKLQDWQHAHRVAQAEIAERKECSRKLALQLLTSARECKAADDFTVEMIDMLFGDVTAPAAFETAENLALIAQVR